MTLFIVGVFFIILEYRILGLRHDNDFLKNEIDKLKEDILYLTGRPSTENDE